MKELQRLYDIHFELLVKKRSRPLSDFYQHRLEKILMELEKDMIIIRHKTHKG